MEQLPLPNPKIRAIFSAVTVIFCFAMIALIVVNGESVNTLHQSALSWSYSLAGFVIAGYIFGAVVDTWAIWRSPVVASSLAANAEEASKQK